MNTFSPLQYFITLSVICGDAPPVNVSGHPSCCSEHFLVHPRVCCVPRVLCERIPREVNADCRHQRIYGLLRERAHLYCTSEPPNTPCRLRDRRYAAGKDAKRTKRRQLVDDDEIARERSQHQPSVTQSSDAGCLVWKGN